MSAIGQFAPKIKDFSGINRRHRISLNEMTTFEGGVGVMVFAIGLFIFAPNAPFPSSDLLFKETMLTGPWVELPLPKGGRSADQ